jgi:hypothetical protein
MSSSFGKKKRADPARKIDLRVLGLSGPMRSSGNIAKAAEMADALHRIVHPVSE